LVPAPLLVARRSPFRRAAASRATARAMAHYHQTGRFYEAEFPDVEELVVVQVLKIDDKIGAYVSLLEYNNKEGMINLGEISKRRIRSMAKLLRIGSTEICMVVSVDQEKGYINLSKKRVAPEDVAPKQEMFAKAKAIHGIMQHVSSTNEIAVEELCNKVSWPLHQNHPTAFDAFKKHVGGELDVWRELNFSEPGLDLSDQQEKLKKDIETVLQRRLIQSMVRLQAKCDVACSEYEGIDAVKDALQEGFKASREECEVNIKLIAHPMFALSCMCRDKDLGIETLDKAMEHIETAIAAKGGSFVMKSRPTFVQKEGEGEQNDDDGGGSSSGGDSSGEEDQDETMGNFNADFSDLMKKDVEGGEDGEKDEE